MRPAQPRGEYAWLRALLFSRETPPDAQCEPVADAPVRRSPHVIARLQEDEAVLLELLDAAGDIVCAIQRAFSLPADVRPEQVERDVLGVQGARPVR